MNKKNEIALDNSASNQAMNREWKRGESIFSSSNNWEMLVQIPRTLNSWVLIETYPPTTVPNWSMDIICYMVHLILKVENMTTSPITRDTLLKFEIPDCNEYINYLLMTNVIEEIKQYKEEKETISYKLTPRYNCSCVSQVILEPRLIEAINRYNDKQASLAESKYPYLMRWLKSDKLYIDDSQAELYNENGLVEGLVSPYFQDKISSYNSQKIIIEGIANRNLYLEYNEKNGDIDTLFDFIPDKLQNFVRYDNKELLSIGVDNSYYLLSILFLDKDKIKNPVIQASIAKNNPKFQNVENFEELIDFIALHQDNEDVIEFKELVQDIFSFNSLIPELDEMGLLDIYDKLRFVMDAIELTFKSKNSLISHIPETEFFSVAFPTVSLIFEKIKENKDNNDSHLTLIETLRTLQVDLYLNRICKRISNQNPNIPIFTKYDYIITTVEHKDIVSRIVKDEFGKILGFNTELFIEYWS